MTRHRVIPSIARDLVHQIRIIADMQRMRFFVAPLLRMTRHRVIPSIARDLIH